MSTRVIGRDIAGIVLIVVLGMALSANRAWASNEKVLLNFTGGGDGSQPVAGLTPDGTGNYYGVTFYGGANDMGVAFKLSKTSSGWRETVLHTFTGGADGGNPEGTLARDAAGNLYGTTDSGGHSNGVAFVLTHSSGSWKEKVLYNFATSETASSGMILDAAGNLYGTTLGGGTFSDGTVYEIQPATGTFTILHSFNGSDGNFPSGGLVFDPAGNLYGTTQIGGSSGLGVAFQLVPSGGGAWTENVLHNFTGGSDGTSPTAQMTIDAAGNLYGTTLQGGSATCEGFGCGTVFQLSNSGGTWTENILHAFVGGSDGSAPLAGVTLDAAGNVYGSTINGGPANVGLLYELKPGSTTWTESVIHGFTNGADGGFPEDRMVLDSAGNIYGTSYSGGTATFGLVFEFKAPAASTP
jgi:uncharacterized repeat protein (TIGR03803 family)